MRLWIEEVTFSGNDEKETCDKIKLFCNGPTRVGQTLSVDFVSYVSSDDETDSREIRSYYLGHWKPQTWNEDLVCFSILRIKEGFVIAARYDFDYKGFPETAAYLVEGDPVGQYAPIVRTYSFGEWCKMLADEAVFDMNYIDCFYKLVLVREYRSQFEPDDALMLDYDFMNDNSFMEVINFFKKSQDHQLLGSLWNVAVWTNGKWKVFSGTNYFIKAGEYIICHTGEGILLLDPKMFIVC